MKVRNIKHRYVWYNFPINRVGMFPTWKVKPISGHRWHGKQLVKRK